MNWFTFWNFLRGDKAPPHPHPHPRLLFLVGGTEIFLLQAPKVKSRKLQCKGYFHFIWMHWRQFSKITPVIQFVTKAVEWPSLPTLPTPPQPPRNSRFQVVLRSFREVVHPLRRESHNSSAPRRDHPSSNLLQPIEQSIESLPLPPLQRLDFGFHRNSTRRDTLKEDHLS